MKTGFSIYLAECLKQTEELQEILYILENSAKKIESVEKELNKLVSSDSFQTTIACLAQQVEEIRENEKSTKALKETLGTIVAEYKKSEKKITNNRKEYSKVIIKDKSEDTSGDKLREEQKWEEVALTIEELRGNSVYSFLRPMMINGVLNDDSRKAILQILSGTYLTSTKIDGVVHLKINQSGKINRELAQWLSDNYDGSWDDYVVRNLKNEGIAIYDTGRDSFLKGYKYFDEITDVKFGEYIESLEKSDTKIKGIGLGKNIKESLVPENFKTSTALGKAGKVLGVAGNVLTVGTDVMDNFYDSEKDEWSFSEKKARDCAVDVGVDVAVGAGASALGGTIGGAIGTAGGPVGIAVGAVAGTAIDIGLNYDFVDLDGDGTEDSVWR